MNILTFDVEEWFHLLDFDATRTDAEWKRYEVRIYENVDRILQILEDTNTKATFFVIGWIAKTYPDIVRNIASRYQIGSHTMNHQLVWQQTPRQFRSEVDSSVKLLEDITGKKVECFRAPGFSITKDTPWAWDILAEAGIHYDSSVFPAIASHGGLPEFGDAVPSIIEPSGIKEFPIVCHKFLGRNFVFNGGGYFRITPYPLIRKWSRNCGNYLLSYIHPRDLDAGQPILDELPLSRRFKSYVGIKGAENKLRSYLSDFKFVDIDTADNMIEWRLAPRRQFILCQ